MVHTLPSWYKSLKEGLQDNDFQLPIRRPGIQPARNELCPKYAYFGLQNISLFMFVRIFIVSLPCLVCNYCDYIKTWCDSICSRFLMFGSGYLNSFIWNKECKFTKDHLWLISFTEEKERYPSFWLYPAILYHALKKMLPQICRSPLWVA